MARVIERLKTNQKGDFYVDSSCIDCGACRWIAEQTFDAYGDYARVYHQPENAEQETAALRALLACPVAAIGTLKKRNLKALAATFPTEIAGGVYHCGFHSEKSFGAASYLIVRDQGNVLVDSPRFNEPLARRIEALGGISQMFLTHCDDVADHEQFAARFGCTRIIHERDLRASTRGVQVVLKGDAPLERDGLTFVPTPGHTRGSTCLIYAQKFLFSGDHVAFSLAMNHVYAFRNACWYSWEEQIRSMQRLSSYRFQHILPGHGAPCHLSEQHMKQQMLGCVHWMKTGQWPQ